MSALLGLSLFDISWDNLAPFLFACLVIETTPGPNMAFLTIVSATKGRRYGYTTTLGILVGLLIIGFAAAAGLTTILSNSPLLYEILRFSGVAYLLWLAWLEWRDKDGIANVKSGETQGQLSYFQHGLIINILNPKSAAFYVTILPTFIDPSGDILRQALILTTISISMATMAHIIIVSLAGFLKPFLDDPKKKRYTRRFFAVMLLTVAIWFGSKAGS